MKLGVAATATAAANKVSTFLYITMIRIMSLSLLLFHHSKPPSCYSCMASFITNTRRNHDHHHVSSSRTLQSKMKMISTTTLFSLTSSSSPATRPPPTITPPKNIAIVGGGLAGLSTAYHLLTYSLSRNKKVPSITIIDKTIPGKGGASSVAGGLLHPFSPQGKLVYLGNEGLEVSNELMKESDKFNSLSCILRQKLYRLALTEANIEKLQQTSSLHPHLATWLSSQEIEEHCHADTKCLGGIVLTNGCKVVDVPTYLDGLWKACEKISNYTATWLVLDEDTKYCKSKEEKEKEVNTNDTLKLWKERLNSFDTVIFSAGAGLFMDSSVFPQKEALKLPIELVRGQSLELTLDSESIARTNFANEALLCGKYIVPLMGQNRILIGATHEYKNEPLNKEEVIHDLQSRSRDISHFVWDNSHVDKVTLGYRVQSKRGKHGRMPMIGKVHIDGLHHNLWLFTGLSSRGLIYHGIFGKVLSEAIIEDDEGHILDQIPEALWWKSNQ